MLNECKLNKSCVLILILLYYYYIVMCLYLFDGVEMYVIYYFFYKFWLKERYVC